jgi:hypothetical protein
MAVGNGRDNVNCADVLSTRYFKSMERHLGIAGYGGVAAHELAQWEAIDLDRRLGKLPQRCYPLVIAGSLCLNPFNQGNYPNDGVLMLEETTLPGEFRHQVRNCCTFLYCTL